MATATVSNGVLTVKGVAAGTTTITTDYGVYTEDGDVGFYCRMENGLIKYMEFSNVEIRVSDTKPRYERIEYDHKPGALRHFAINMYDTDKIIYLPKDATIRPVMQSTVG